MKKRKNNTILLFNSNLKILEEICLKEGFGMPSFTLHTTNGNDQDGKEIGLYMYKVADNNNKNTPYKFLID